MLHCNKVTFRLNIYAAKEQCSLIQLGHPCAPECERLCHETRPDLLPGITSKLFAH